MFVQDSTRGHIPVNLCSFGKPFLGEAFVFKVSGVLFCRFPVNTIGLWDDIFETYNARDALKKQLQIQKINTMRAEHAASMATILREIEMLDSDLESDQRTHSIFLEKLSEQRQKSNSLNRKPKTTIKLFQSSNDIQINEF